MKNNILLSLTLSTLSLAAFGQADIWTSVITNGFGNSQNFDVVEFMEFNDTLYAGCGRKGTGSAQMFRSGDGTTWNQVTNFSPPLHPSVKSIHSFGKTLSDSIMWMATGGGLGTQVYRTTDGINWTLINTYGFGTPGNVTGAPNMVVFQPTGDTTQWLYAGAGSHGGSTNAEVWRIPIESSNSFDWEKIVDFDTVATLMTSDTVDLISYFTVWNNKIYFGTNGKGQLWESSNGINFTQNALAPFGQYGFGVPSQIVIACLQVFNDTLYATTTNKILGGQMYRTGDGINWQTITTNAFGKADTVEELHNMDTAFGHIWVTAYTDTSISSGCPIWRSADGVNFIQSNIDGFGNPLIDGENAVTISFGNSMYFGGPNYTAGAQIWRTDMTTGINQSELKNYSVNLYPNPFSSQTTLLTDKVLKNASLTIFNSFGQTVKQIDNLSGQTIIFHRDNLPSGQYFVRLTQDGNIISVDKFVITDK